MFNSKLYPFLFVCLLFSACRDLENNLNIPLHAEEHELVVECYLEPGKPYQLLLTATKDFSDIVNICPFVKDALVTITHNGVIDTLKESEFTSGSCSSIIPYFNTDSTRFFNYGSTTICPTNYSQPFILEVWDTIDNRYVIATTQLIPKVPIHSFTYTYNTDSLAFAAISCQDNLNTKNYYRIMVHKNKLVEDATQGLFNKVATNPEIDEIIYDDNLFANGNISAITGYAFRPRDTIIGTIYHIDQDYYDFLISIRNAQDANNIPFIEPTPVISNVQGGNGIFTFLSYDRDSLFLP